MAARTRTTVDKTQDAAAGLASASEDVRVADGKREAAERRRAAAEQGYVDALLRERQGYVTRGLDGRVAAVDAELERLGVGAE